MTYRPLLAAAAAAALMIPATTAAAQSWPEILGAVVQAQASSSYSPYNGQYNGRYDDNRYGDRRDNHRRISERQAIRIAQRQGVRVQSANRRGNHYDLVGRANNGQRVSLRVDARTGQITRFYRQRAHRDNDRWDRDDRSYRDHDRRDHRRDRDHDDDDD